MTDSEATRTLLLTEVQLGVKLKRAPWAAGTYNNKKPFYMRYIVKYYFFGINRMQRIDE